MNNHLPFRMDGVYVHKIDKEKEINPKPTRFEKWVNNVLNKDDECYYYICLFYEDFDYTGEEIKSLGYKIKMLSFHGELLGVINGIFERYIMSGSTIFDSYNITNIIDNKIFFEKEGNIDEGCFLQNKDFLLLFGPLKLVFIPFMKISIMDIPKEYRNI